MGGLSNFVAMTIAEVAHPVHGSEWVQEPRRKLQDNTPSKPLIGKVV